MKKQTLILFAGAMMAVAAMANAQTPLPGGMTLSIVFDGADTDSINGASSIAEYDGVTVTPDGNTIYLFDSINEMDGLIKYNAGTPTVFATEAQIASPSGSPNVSAGDLAADATNLYANNFLGTSGQNRLQRIAHGAGGSGTVMIVEGGVEDDNVDEIAVDNDNSRIVFSRNDAFAPAVDEGIETVPLTATLATPTVIANETALEVALATITGYVDDLPANDDINITDVTVQSDGDIILSHGFTSTRDINGSLLRVTETGTVSVFRSADDIITSAGGTPATVNIGSVSVNTLPNDDILIIVAFSSDTNALKPFMAVISADGATQTQIATDAELLASLTPTEQSDLTGAGAGTFFFFDGKATVGVDTAGNIIFFRQTSGANILRNAVLKLTGVPAFTSVNDWNLF